MPGEPPGGTHPFLMGIPLKIFCNLYILYPLCKVSPSPRPRFSLQGPGLFFCLHDFSLLQHWETDPDFYSSPRSSSARFLQYFLIVSCCIHCHMTRRPVRSTHDDTDTVDLPMPGAIEHGHWVLCRSSS